MGKIICISSQKGGVGKTTTAVNLSTALALAEQNTLLLDLDFQGHATGVLASPDRHEGFSIYDVLAGKSPVEDTIRDTGIEFFKLISSDTRLINIDYGPGPVIGKDSTLRIQLNTIKKDFDFIIIDSPSSFNRVGITAINAADVILIPLQCEYFALESLAQFFKIFHGIKKKYNYEAEIGGILLNMYDPQEAVSAQIACDVKKGFDGLVYKSVVPRCRSIRESASHGKSIILTDISSEGAKSYISLAREIIKTMHSSQE